MTQRSATSCTLLLPLAELAIVAIATVACDAQVDPDYSGEPLATLRGDVDADGNLDADVGVLWYQAGPELGCSGPVPSCSVDIGGMIGDELDYACIQGCDEQFAECSTAAQAFDYGDCLQGCGVTSVEIEPYFELCVDAGVGERVPVQGEFPAMFDLDLFAPPPEAALLADESGLRGAIGIVIAIDPEAEDVGFDQYTHALPAAILGNVSTHVLFYAPAEIPAESSWGRFVGGALTPGYHLLAVMNDGPDCSEAPPEDECEETVGWLEPAPDDLATGLTLDFAASGELDWPAF